MLTTQTQGVIAGLKDKTVTVTAGGEAIALTVGSIAANDVRAELRYKVDRYAEATEHNLFPSAVICYDGGEVQADSFLLQIQRLLAGAHHPSDLPAALIPVALARLGDLMEALAD